MKARRVSVGLPTAALGLAATAVLAAPGPAQVTTLDTTACPDGSACAWSQKHYQGDRVVKDNTAAGFHTLNGDRWSVKNRFNNRKVVFRGDRGDYCVNPGGEVGDPFFAAHLYNIGQQGSRC